jgi:uncharacterized membrane protein YtjA (UPF0391 family)
MLYHAFLFFSGVVMFAGLFGFGATAFAAVGLAKFLFCFFLILLLASLISHLGRGERI